MVDRRSSINYINDKYLGKRGTSYIQPTIITTPTTPTIIPTTTIVDTHGQHDLHQEINHSTPVVEQRIAKSSNGKICGCPWWLCLLLTLLALLLLGVLIGFLTGLFGNKSQSTTETTGTTTSSGNEESQGQVNGGTVEQGCKQGFFAHNGKCISCPQGSSWNGENCIKNNNHLFSE